MQIAKTILVTGGTGNQDGAVARNLISKEFKVKVLSRNPSSINSLQLSNLGIQLVAGD